MTKAQWKAIYDYCEALGCSTKDLMDELKANGTVERNTRLEDLDKCAYGKSYEDMLNFLEENV